MRSLFLIPFPPEITSHSVTLSQVLFPLFRCLHNTSFSQGSCHGTQGYPPGMPLSGKYLDKLGEEDKTQTNPLDIEQGIRLLSLNTPMVCIDGWWCMYSHKKMTRKIHTQWWNNTRTPWHNWVKQDIMWIVVCILNFTCTVLSLQDKLCSFLWEIKEILSSHFSLDGCKALPICQRYLVSREWCPHGPRGEYLYNVSIIFIQTYEEASYKCLCGLLAWESVE